MEESRVTANEPLENRLPESTHARGPVVASSSLDVPIVEDSQKPGYSAHKSTRETSRSQLEGGGTTDEGIARCPNSGSASARDVVVLGTASPSSLGSIPKETLDFAALRRMRPCDLVDLFNATPLGRVLNERTLYRHRMRARGMIGKGKRVDLFQYVGWLIHQRRDRRSAELQLQGPVTVAGVLQLLKTHGYCCALTGRRLTPKTCALDHIVPVSHGGEHLLQNAQVLHKAVNRAKGTMTNEEFIQMCREVAAYADRVTQPQAEAPPP